MAVEKPNWLKNSYKYATSRKDGLKQIHTSKETNPENQLYQLNIQKTKFKIVVAAEPIDLCPLPEIMKCFPFLNLPLVHDSDVV